MNHSLSKKSARKNTCHCSHLATENANKGQHLLKTRQNHRKKNFIPYKDYRALLSTNQLYRSCVNTLPFL